MEKSYKYPGSANFSAEIHSPILPRMPWVLKTFGPGKQTANQSGIATVTGFEPTTERGQYVSKNDNGWMALVVEFDAPEGWEPPTDLYGALAE